MKKSTKENISATITVIIMMSVVFLAGRWSDNPKTIIISERLEACEKLGGHYAFDWQEFYREDSKYVERCEIPSQTLSDF